MTETAATMRERNRAAWNAGRYEAWVSAYGAPAAQAEALAADPAHKVRRLQPHLGDVAGRRICNLQGSHGRVAVALALLGADVAVVDFAEETRRSALELAAAAGVAMDYRLADVLETASLGFAPFDAASMELGILPYHQHCNRFFGPVGSLLKPGGRMVLHEFHPVQRELFQAGGPADYFNAALMIGDVPNPVAGGPSLGTCAFRLWTLGEIVTATSAAGLQV